MTSTKTKAAHWITDEGVLLHSPETFGYKETDCGPNMWTHPSHSGYCERIAGFRLHVDSLEGTHTHTSKTLLGIRALCVSHGFISPEGVPMDGGVESYGVSRYAGLSYKLGNHWYPLSISLSAISKA